MALENTSGLDVFQHYGPRDVGGYRGTVKTEGIRKELILSFDAADVTATTYQLAPTLPANTLLTGAYAKVSEAFALGGTTPTILVGTAGSEVTNGIVVSEAQAEAIGIYDVTSTKTGTWNAVLAADTEIGLALGGTTPTITAAGKCEVILTYIQF